MSANPVLEGVEWFTNSTVLALAVFLFILWLARTATKNVQKVPSGIQNFVELIVESVYGLVEGIVGPKVAPKAFPLLATIFVFFLFSNWFGLIPGVGTVGYGPASALPLGIESAYEPLLRPATADLNMTLGVALVFMIAWLVISLREVGLGHFLHHLFGSKGGKQGLFMTVFLGVIFALVGVIEVVSIAFRPVSLSLRLYGNIFAGENLLHTMSTLGGQFFDNSVVQFILSVILPLPFYFLELLVGFVQALVFVLLCAVYIQLSTEHDEEEGAHA